MFNFTADSDIYQWVSSGGAHKQPAPWIKASWPEVGGETDVYRDGGRQKRQSIVAF